MAQRIKFPGFALLQKVDRALEPVFVEHLIARLAASSDWVTKARTEEGIRNER